MKKPKQKSIKRNDLPHRKHVEFLDIWTKAAIASFEDVHGRIVKDIIRLLKAEKLAKSEIKRGWTGKVPGFTIDLTNSIEKVISRYLKALDFMMLGDYAGDDAAQAIHDLGLTDKVPVGSVYGAYLQAIDTQAAYYKTLFGVEPPVMPKAVMNQAYETIQGQAARSVKATLDGYRNRMLDTVEMALKENRGDALAELMERAHALDEKTKKKALDRAAKETATTAKTKDIKSDIADIFEKSTADFERMAETTIGMASSVGTHQAILEIFGSQDSELRACLVSVRDDRCCDDCDQFSRNADGSLKTYKMKDFKPAGYNFGKKKGDWLLSLPLIHHKCRCSLIYLPPGFTVENDGTIRPIKKNS